MSSVFLVRHGQAQPGAQDETTYDNLTDLGHRQADLLGAYLASSHHEVSRIIVGDLNRQQQTADYLARHLGVGFQVDPRLRELDYFGLAQSLLAYSPCIAGCPG